jgi:hypothetical protein
LLDCCSKERQNAHFELCKLNPAPPEGSGPTCSVTRRQSEPFLSKTNNSKDKSRSQTI